jgi:hypothetical protein
VVGGELARVQRHCGDLALVDADLDPATREAGIERVVVAIKAQIGLLGHPDHEPPVDIGQPGRQRPHPSPLLDEALKRDRPDGAVSAGVGLVGPAVELVLEIQLVGKAPAGLEVRPQIAVRALEHALGLRVTRLEDDPPDPELTAEGSELRCGSPATRMDRALAIAHQLLGQRPEPPQAAAHAPGNVGPLLGEDQRALNRPRPAQLRGHHPAAPLLMVTDRNRLARLPQIKLAQLPRPINRALIGASHEKPRPHLAHPVIEDRLATHIAQLLRQLAQAHRRDAWIGPQLLLDPALERIQLRLGGRAAIDRRTLADQRATDRLAVKPGTAMDLTDRQPLDPIHPPHLRPLLHADHQLPLARPTRPSEGQDPARLTGPTPGGSLFDRRRRVSIQAAPTIVFRLRYACSA